MQEGAVCRACNGALSGPVLALGPLPPCNRFSDAGPAADTRPLTLASCGRCGLVQLTAFGGENFLIPRVSWISYNEPAAHLDDAVARVLRRMELPHGAHVLGTGPFDGPLLERFAARGFAIEHLDLLHGLEPATGTYPYLETMQAQLRSDRLGGASQPADLVVCRYLLEHCDHPVEALRALAQLAKPAGHLLVEIPGSGKFLARQDYSFLWEEHVSYFTPATFMRLAAAAGFATICILTYENLLEDQLVAVLCRGQAEPPALDPAEQACFDAYAAAFAEVKQATLARAKIIGKGHIGLLGAGHQALMYVNALGLAPYIGAVYDDNPDKIGRYTPGITAPIRSSAQLDDESGVNTCLLATNPAIEPQIREKRARFAARGGTFYSIFRGVGRPTLSEPQP